jgi:alpha-amylase
MSAVKPWRITVALLLAMTIPGDCRAGVLLQGYYLRAAVVGGKTTERGVPSPADPQDHVSDFWWDHLARQAKALSRAGFTAVWLPVPHKGASGTASIGFDVFDDYDIGSKNQKGSVTTRYGTREQLERCVAVMRANGLDVYVDIVENQRSGGSGPGGFTFRYADADGKTPGGRFPKDRDNFHNRDIPQDPDVFGPDFSFGPDLAPINGKPPGYVSGGLEAGADWLTRALDIQGFRFDDAKGVSTRFARALFDFGALKGKFVVGEFFDGNTALVRSWISGPIGMNNRASAFDFPLRLDLLAPMCNNAGFFDMSQLDHGGLAGADPIHAVTFVENHDTDINFPIVRNKAQAYAYILTAEGYPCVYYKDYSTDPGCFGMKPTIDPLIFIHERIAAGATQQRFKDHDIFAYERMGGSHLLVGLNNNGDVAHTITVATGFGANAPLHDYTGHAGDVRTDGSGKATITIPRNTNGLGYVCYSRPGIGPAATAAGHAVTQDYEGAQDLDIKPADNTALVDVCRVYVAAGQPIRGSLGFDTSHWTDTTRITLELDGPGGAAIATHEYSRTTPQGEALTASAASTGFHTFRIRSSGTPAENLKPSYKLSVTYRAPETIEPAP